MEFLDFNGYGMHGANIDDTSRKVLARQIQRRRRKFQNRINIKFMSENIILRLYNTQYSDGKFERKREYKDVWKIIRKGRLPASLSKQRRQWEAMPSNSMAGNLQYQFGNNLAFSVWIDDRWVEQIEGIGCKNITVKYSIKVGQVGVGWFTGYGWCIENIGFNSCLFLYLDALYLSKQYLVQG